MMRALVVVFVVTALLGAVVELSCVAGELTGRPTADVSEVAPTGQDIPTASEVDEPPLAARPALTR